LLLLPLFSLGLFANDTIKIDYNYEPPAEGITPALKELWRETTSTMNFLGVDMKKITITGNIKGKNFVAYSHVVKDGKDSLHSADTLIFPNGMDADTLKINVRSIPVDSNKVKIERDFDRRILMTPTYDMGSNQGCILMETSLRSNENPNACGTDFYSTTEKIFPIMAYSQGIPMEYGADYCGLRDTGVHPKLWFEKFKIKNYVYFEIEFIESEEAE
jgi:hypothetical protein